MANNDSWTTFRSDYYKLPFPLGGITEPSHTSVDDSGKKSKNSGKARSGGFLGDLSGLTRAGQAVQQAEAAAQTKYSKALASQLHDYPWLDDLLTEVAKARLNMYGSDEDWSKDKDYGWGRVIVDNEIPEDNDYFVLGTDEKTGDVYLGVTDAGRSLETSDPKKYKELKQPFDNFLARPYTQSLKPMTKADASRDNVEWYPSTNELLNTLAETHLGNEYKEALYQAARNRFENVVNDESLPEHERYLNTAHKLDEEGLLDKQFVLPNGLAVGAADFVAPVVSSVYFDPEYRHKTSVPEFIARGAADAALTATSFALPYVGALRGASLAARKGASAIARGFASAAGGGAGGLSNYGAKRLVNEGFDLTTGHGGYEYPIDLVDAGIETAGGALGGFLTAMPKKKQMSDLATKMLRSDPKSVTPDHIKKSLKLTKENQTKKAAKLPFESDAFTQYNAEFPNNRIQVEAFPSPRQDPMYKASTVTDVIEQPPEVRMKEDWIPTEAPPSENLRPPVKVIKPEDVKAQAPATRHPELKWIEERVKNPEEMPFIDEWNLDGHKIDLTGVPPVLRERYVAMLNDVEKQLVKDYKLREWADIMNEGFSPMYKLPIEKPRPFNISPTKSKPSEPGSGTAVSLKDILDLPLDLPDEDFIIENLSRPVSPAKLKDVGTVKQAPVEQAASEAADNASPEELAAQLKRKFGGEAADTPKKTAAPETPAKTETPDTPKATEAAKTEEPSPEVKPKEEEKVVIAGLLPPGRKGVSRPTVREEVIPRDPITRTRKVVKYMRMPPHTVAGAYLADHPRLSDYLLPDGSSNAIQEGLNHMAGNRAKARAAVKEFANTKTANKEKGWSTEEPFKALKRNLRGVLGYENKWFDGKKHHYTPADYAELMSRYDGPNLPGDVPQPQNKLIARRMRETAKPGNMGTINGYDTFIGVADDSPQSAAYKRANDEYAKRSKMSLVDVTDLEKSKPKGLKPWVQRGFGGAVNGVTNVLPIGSNLFNDVSPYVYEVPYYHED